MKFLGDADYTDYSGSFNIHNLPNGLILDKMVSNGELFYLDILGELKKPSFSSPYVLFDKQGKPIHKNPQTIKLLDGVHDMDKEDLYSDWPKYHRDNIQFAFSKDDNNHIHLILFDEGEMKSLVNFRDFGFCWFVFNYMILFYAPSIKTFLVYDKLQGKFYKWKEKPLKELGVYEFEMTKDLSSNFECREISSEDYRKFIKFYTLPTNLPKGTFKKLSPQRKEIHFNCTLQKMFYGVGDTSNLSDSEMQPNCGGCDLCRREYFKKLSRT